MNTDYIKKIREIKLGVSESWFAPCSKAIFRMRTVFCLSNQTGQHDDGKKEGNRKQKIENPWSPCTESNLYIFRVCYCIFTFIELPFMDGISLGIIMRCNESEISCVEGPVCPIDGGYKE